MENIEIIETGVYLPKHLVLNKDIENKFNLEKGYIQKRTGINKRYYAEEETIEKMAIEAVKNLQRKEQLENIGMIITATTSSNNLMPGISNIIQKKFNINTCICLDILAGCSGYINALDIARLYIATNKVENVLVIGVDKLSKYTNKEDIGTSIVLSDGAGAILIARTEISKRYYSNIESEKDESEILICKSDSTIKMQGKEVYKYAVTKTVDNIHKILKQSGEKIEDIKYIIPHQSNTKIMKSIANRLKIPEEKIYINIQNVGNTFCASIPIVIDEMKTKELLKKGDKVILLGYGGGLNTGSILLEI